MATTTNFGWETPDDTDLVKDGALAMRTLGNAIDTSLVDLKGGTTGQILSKTSNTDMDFTWITNDVGDITAVTAGTGISGGGTSGAVTITNSMATEITASGDIIVGTGSGTFDNLPIGTTGQVLTADTTVSPYKVKWATAGGASFVGCSLYDSNATQTIATGTDTIVTFNSEDFDTDGFHSTSSNTGRITIPSGKGGKYLFIASAFFVNVAAGKEARFYKNGSQLRTTGWSSASGVAGNPIVAVLNLVATDYIEFRVVQSSGGNADLYKGGGGAGEYAWFSCVYLGA